MNFDFNLTAVGIFLIFFLPGLISLRIYRLLMPSRHADWEQSLLDALFYSSINFAALLPLVYRIHINNFPANHPRLYWISVLLILLVAPVVWPFVLRLIFRSKKLTRKIQIPYPTAWDYFFDMRKEVFVLFHLNNGSMVGGFWGPDSYAGSFPNDGDMYLQAVYAVDEHGKFGDPISDTRGLLIAKGQYTYVELFAVPTMGEE